MVALKEYLILIFGRMNTQMKVSGILFRKYIYYSDKNVWQTCHDGCCKTDCTEGAVQSLEVNIIIKPTTLMTLQINHKIIIKVN